MAELEALKRAAQDLSDAEINAGPKIADARMRDVTALKAESEAMKTVTQNADIYNRQVAWRGATSETQFQSNLARQVEYQRLLNIQLQRGFTSPAQDYAWRQQELAQRLIWNRASQGGYTTPEQYLGYLSAHRQAMALENVAWAQRAVLLRSATDAQLGQVNALHGTHLSAAQLAGTTAEAKAALTALGAQGVAPSLSLSDAQFQRALAGSTSSLRSLDATSVSADVTLDDSQLLSTVAADTAALGTLGKMVATPKAELDASGFMNGIAAVEIALAKASAMRISYGAALPVAGGTARVPMAGGANAGAGPPVSADSAEAAADKQIMGALRAITSQQGQYTSLAKLREELKLTREEADAALIRLYKIQQVNLVPQSNRQALTDTLREAGIDVGGETKHRISLGVKAEADAIEAAAVREIAAQKAEADAAEAAAVREIAAQKAEADAAEAATAREIAARKAEADAVKVSADAQEKAARKVIDANVAVSAATQFADTAQEETARRTADVADAATVRETIAQKTEADVAGTSADTQEKAAHRIIDAFAATAAAAKTAAAAQVAAYQAAADAAKKSAADQAAAAAAIRAAMSGGGVTGGAGGKGGSGGSAGAAAAAAGAAGGGKGGGTGSFWANTAASAFQKISSFTGPLGATVTALGGVHIAIDAVIEALAVWVPALATAGLGLGAFALIGEKSAQQVYTYVKSFHTATDALGQNMTFTATAMKGMGSQATIRQIQTTGTALQDLQNQARPKVWQLYGDAIDVMASGSGKVLGQLGLDAGTVLDRIAAHITVAMSKGGNGLKNFTDAGKHDIAGLAQAFSNIGSLLGALIGVSQKTHVAEFLLGAGVAITHVAKIAADFIRTPFGGTLTAWVIGLHALQVWSGVAAAGIGTLLTAAGKIPLIGRAFTGLNAVLGRVSPDVMKGGIFATAAIAAFIIWVVRAQDAAQKFAQSQIDLVKNSTPTTMVNTTVSALGKVTAAWQEAVRTGSADAATLGTSRQQLLGDFTLESERLTQISHMYGVSLPDAMALAQTAGIKVSDFTDTNNSHWTTSLQLIAGMVTGYENMGQKAGSLGADMDVLSVTTGDQVKKINDLNTAWQTWFGTITGGQTTMATFSTSYGTFTKDIKNSKSTYDTVNTDFQTLITNGQGLVAANLKAGASSKLQLQAVADIGAGLVTAAGNNKTWQSETVKWVQQSAPWITTFQQAKTWIDNASGSLKGLQGNQNAVTQGMPSLAQQAAAYSKLLSTDLSPAQATAAKGSQAVTNAIGAFTTSLEKNGAKAGATKKDRQDLLDQLHKAGVNSKDASKFVNDLAGFTENLGKKAATAHKPVSDQATALEKFRLSAKKIVDEVGIPLEKILGKVVGWLAAFGKTTVGRDVTESIAGLLAGIAVLKFSGVLSLLGAIGKIFGIGGKAKIGAGIAEATTTGSAKMGEAFTTGAAKLGESIQTALGEGGTVLAAKIKEALAAGGATAGAEEKAGTAEGGAVAGAEEKAGEVTGGATAGAEEAAGEVSGGATAGTEIATAEAAGGAKAGTAALGAEAAGATSLGTAIAGAIGVGLLAYLAFHAQAGHLPKQIKGIASDKGGGAPGGPSGSNYSATHPQGAGGWEAATGPSFQQATTVLQRGFTDAQVNANTLALDAYNKAILQSGVNSQSALDAKKRLIALEVQEGTMTQPQATKAVMDYTESFKPVSAAMSLFTDKLATTGFSLKDLKGPADQLAKSLLQSGLSAKDAHAKFDALTTSMGLTKPQADQLWASLKHLPRSIADIPSGIDINTHVSVVAVDNLLKKIGLTPAQIEAVNKLHIKPGTSVKGLDDMLRKLGLTPLQIAAINENVVKPKSSTVNVDTLLKKIGLTPGEITAVNKLILKPGDNTGSIDNLLKRIGLTPGQIAAINRLIIKPGDNTGPIDNLLKRIGLTPGQIANVNRLIAKPGSSTANVDTLLRKIGLTPGQIANVNRLLIKPSVDTSSIDAAQRKLNALKQQPPPIYLSEFITVKKKARGGMIEGGVLGAGDEDTVPALLTPGEYVIRKPARKALEERFGPDVMSRLNQADRAGIAHHDQHFAHGGGVQPTYGMPPHWSFVQKVASDTQRTEHNAYIAFMRAVSRKASKLSPHQRAVYHYINTLQTEEEQWVRETLRRAAKWDKRQGRVAANPSGMNFLFRASEHFVRNYDQEALKQPSQGGYHWRDLADISPSAYERFEHGIAGMMVPLQSLAREWGELRYAAAPRLINFPVHRYQPPPARLPDQGGLPPATFAAGGSVGTGSLMDKLSMVPMASGGSIDLSSIRGLGMQSRLPAAPSVRNAAAQASSGPGASGAHVEFHGGINITNPVAKAAPGSITSAVNRAAWLAGRELS